MSVGRGAAAWRGAAAGRGAALRPTRQRAAVASALEHSPTFASAQELHQLLAERGETVGLATVYRTLQGLVDSGEVDSLRGPDGEVLYRKCERTGHHHHLVCRVCGRTEELDARSVETWVAAMAAERGFTEVDHTIELFGRCADCSAH